MKILYVCNIFDPENIKINQITSDSPAAYQKVLSVCKAIKTTGTDISILSLGICNSKKLELRNQIIEGISIKYIRNVKNKIIRNLLALVVLRKYISVEKPDCIIFYNYLINYFFAINYFSRKNKKLLIDIEDAVNTELGKFSYSFRKKILNYYLKKTSGNALVVSTLLQNWGGVKKSLVVYGTGDAVDKKEINERIQLLFCGSMVKETGCEVLLELIGLLSKDQILSQKVFINICGFGPYAEKIVDVCYRNQSFTKFYGKVDRKQYKKLLSISDIGLVLKMKESSMAKTTFPSKVVEFALAHLSMIAIPSSDIPILFESNEVYFIDNAENIVEVLKNIVSNRKQFVDQNNNVFEKSKKLFDYNNVGERIISYINNLECS